MKYCLSDVGSIADFTYLSMFSTNAFIGKLKILKREARTPKKFSITHFNLDCLSCKLFVLLTNLLGMASSAMFLSYGIGLKEQQLTVL